MLNNKRNWMLFVAGIVLVAFYYKAGPSFLSLSSTQVQLASLKIIVQEHFAISVLMFSLIYIITTALSFPGASVLTLLAGALFGVIVGSILVSVVSTIGATLAFLGTRLLFKDTVQKKYSMFFKKINDGMEADGTYYLLSLRLAPVVPFFMVNMVMGLTSISAFRFFWISQLGMLPGTVAYVYAGRNISELTSLSDVVTVEVTLALFGLAALPWFGKAAMEYFRQVNIYKAYKKPKRFDYNTVVIGAGSAGLVSSYIAATVKAKVALIEKDKMGGDCLNSGCVPSKAFIASAKMAHAVRKAQDFGVSNTAVSVSFAKIMERVHSVIAKIAPNDSRERYTQRGVECFSGDAEILSPFEVKCGDRVLTTKNIVIASGAEPIVPAVSGLKTYLTSENLWTLKEQPKTLLIVGAGAIGCELAQAFCRLGSLVTLIDKSPKILNSSEPEVSLMLEQILTQEGVVLKLNTELVRIEENNFAIVLDEKEQTEAIHFDQVLFAIGRRARTAGLGLEKLGITLDEKGFIAHDKFLATRFPNIFVCGDCAGPFQLTHAAAHQAWYATLNGLLRPFKQFAADYRVMPQVVFTSPEIAQVGLTEAEARAQMADAEVTKYSISELDRAICEGEENGFVKFITGKNSDQILGATFVAAHAGESISEIVLAMKHRLGLKKILATTHAYPTWAEANKFAAGRWQTSNVPPWGLRFLKRYHAWRRS